MSNNRIFQNQVRFIPSDPPGRNVNLATSNVRRTPIFNHIPVQKLTSSPFANYNSPLTQIKYAQSQSTLGQQMSISDFKIQSLRQEINKIQSFSQNNRKIINIMQTELRDVKQRLSQYHAQYITQAKNNSILMQERITNTLNLKIQEQLRQQEAEDKQKLKQFLVRSNTMVLSTVEQKIKSSDIILKIQQQIETLKQKIINEDFKQGSINLGLQSKDNFGVQNINIQKIQILCSKLQKQLETNKKNISQIYNKIKDIQQCKNTNHEQIYSYINNVKQKIKNIQLDTQKKLTNYDLKLSNIDGNNALLKQKISQLQKYNQEQRSLFLDFNKKLSSQQSSQPADLKLQMNKSQELSQSITVRTSLDQKTSPKKQTIIQQPIITSFYQVDTQGYLMDGDGKYILTQTNRKILLSAQQINSLIDSQAVKILQS